MCLLEVSAEKFGATASPAAATAAVFKNSRRLVELIARGCQFQEILPIPERLTASVFVSTLVASMSLNKIRVIALLLIAALRTWSSLSAEARLLDARRIWDAAPHNAFTDLIRFHDEFLCVFREGAGHVAPDGKIRVIASKDGTNWNSVALITQAARDLRDPKITRMPDGSLMIYAAAADRPRTPVTHQSIATFSKDGRTWSEPIDIADKNVWLWRLAWKHNVGYGIGYDTAGEKSVRLYKTTDGKKFETVLDPLYNEQSPNESGLVFEPDGTLLCLLRRDGQPGHGLFGSAKPPYTKWQWKDVGAKIGGPQMIRLHDGRLIGAVRLYDGGARASVVQIDRDSGRLTELVKLPSGGDCSYPGLVFYQNQLWVSYYSSHEGKTSIYLARVALD